MVYMRNDISRTPFCEIDCQTFSIFWVLESCQQRWQGLDSCTARQRRVWLHECSCNHRSSLSSDLSSTPALDS